MMKEIMVRVEWDDASYDSGYYDKTELQRYTQLKTVTVGHLVRRDGKQVLVAMDKWKNSRNEYEYRHISTIPKKMITRIVELKGG